jgi:murein DD-endopeptidase MepM/ murein hydrolase activator NlpD
MEGPKQTRDARPAAASLAVLVLFAFWMTSTTPVAEAAPPSKKTYFMVFIGLQDTSPWSWVADCVTFTRNRVCNAREQCGPWKITDQSGKKTVAFSFEIDAELHGSPLVVEAQGRLTDRGSSHSIGGSAWVRHEGEIANFGFTARPVKRRLCPVVLEEFIHKAQAQPQCMQEATFPEPAQSEYVLPYPVGDEHVIYATYCNGFNHWFGYDFRMPIGSPLVAARAGTVTEVRDDLPDDASTPDPSADSAGNHVFIQHSDGSTANYSHMQRGSALVTEGQSVEAGTPIGNSGYSGRADRPHLHFDVFTQDGRILPVNFRNARGRLDPRRGLMKGESYRALPY